MLNTVTGLQAWWDSAMDALSARLAGHPLMVFIIGQVKSLGDKFIPTISGQIPNLPTPQAAFDYIMGLLEVRFPAEALYLKIVQGLVDAWLGSAGMLPALPK